MPEERNLKEQLHSLRIDREAPRPPIRSPFGMVAAIVAGAVVLAVGAFLASGALRRSTPTVRVAKAELVAGGESPGAPVLSGAGYVITAEKYIAIGVRVPGRIERFLVDEGDRVEPGQPLVELDDRDYRAQMGRAEAAVRLARANRDLARAQLARVRKLFAESVTSKEELDEAVGKFEVADASVAQAASELAQARVNLDDTVLHSPVRGVVLAKFKGVGEIAVPGGFAGAGDLLRIADLSELRAEVDVSESDLGQVHLGQRAELVPDAYPDRRYRAVVVKRKPQVNRQKGTLTVEVRIEDPDEALLPDMSARVTFLATADPGAVTKQPRVMIPRAALRQDGEGSFVWLVVDGRARRRAVETGEAVGEAIAVARGLSGGEMLIVGPAESLREGDAVGVS
jgi:RND family efflux transporter MFP subunit